MRLITLARALLLLSLGLVACSKKTINLTPDVIREYGLDQVTLPNVQLYYRAITVRADSTVTTDEPTIFRRIDPGNAAVTDSQSSAASRHLDKSDIIILKNGTPCRVAEVLDKGRILRVDFGNLKLDFELCYKSGYNFKLAGDTAIFQGKTYVLSRVPLLQTFGILSVDKRSLDELSDTEIRIKGKRIDEGGRR